MPEETQPLEPAEDEILEEIWTSLGKQAPSTDGGTSRTDGEAEE